MRLPAYLVAALGLLGASGVALVISVAGYSGQAVAHLVTVPGIAQHGAVLGASASRTNSPFAVYSPPPSTPPPAQAAPPEGGTAPAPAPPPQPGPKKKPHH